VTQRCKIKLRHSQTTNNGIKIEHHATISYINLTNRDMENSSKTWRMMSYRKRTHFQRVEKKDAHWMGWNSLFLCPRSCTKDLILLDRDSTDTIFCNPKYVKNIRQDE